MQMYDLTLPHSFPWKYSSTRTTIRYMVNKLIDPARYLGETPNGSSFAVTVDAAEGMWNLWLSEASKDFLVQNMAHISRNLIDTKYIIE